MANDPPSDPIDIPNTPAHVRNQAYRRENPPPMVTSFSSISDGSASSSEIFHIEISGEGLSGDVPAYEGNERATERNPRSLLDPKCPALHNAFCIAERLHGVLRSAYMNPYFDPYRLAVLEDALSGELGDFVRSISDATQMIEGLIESGGTSSEGSLGNGSLLGGGGGEADDEGSLYTNADSLGDEPEEKGFFFAGSVDEEEPKV